MGYVLELKNIGMNFHDAQGETIAVDDVSFGVSRGEFVSIVGPSGCGKSTLLSIISGMVKPSRGECTIGGTPVSAGGKTHSTVGYMLQSDHLFEWRTIMGNVRLGLEVRKDLTPASLTACENLLSRYGLAEFRDHRPSQLSGGMRQRAALIRTLAIDPAILLLDEPFSALDFQTRLHVTDDISTIIRKEGRTAVLVTHDISEAVSVSDRVIVLSKRPSRILNIHSVGLSDAETPPIKAREHPSFRKHFNTIWKELEG
ncbi:MAG: ABC transporter ATP-binding protein [Defluviitaleaceae bacterium]|nr:ABC transporter ATP-binding protein [Defluviitaleaceae bacterium]